MKTRIRQGLLAGLALAAILAMPGIGRAAAEDFTTLFNSTNEVTVGTGQNAADTKVTMDADGTLKSGATDSSSNEGTSLIIGTGGEFEVGAAGKTLTVDDGGVLTFEDNSTFTKAASGVGIILFDGGTTSLTIGENGITGLSDLLNGTSGIDLQAGNLNVNFEADVAAATAMAMSAAEGGTVNINILAGKTVGDSTSLTVDVGKAALVINNNGTAAFNTVAAGNVTIKGVNSFDGAVGATYTNAAINATEDITISAGNIVIQSGENTFANNATTTANHTTAAAITLTGDGDISINGGNIDIQGGTNTFTGNVAASYTHSAGDVTISGDGAISITGGNIDIRNGTNDFQGTLTAAYSQTGGDFSVNSDPSYTPTVHGGNINISGGTSNTFGGILTAGNDINITGGTNTFRGNLTATNGAIAFTGGTNTFDGTITLTANSDITFGAAAFLADSASLTATQDLIFNAALTAQGASSVVASSNAITFSGATINLGSNTLSVNATNVAFAGANTITASNDGSDYGALAVTGTMDFTQSNGITLTLDGEKGSWTNQKLITGANLTDGDEANFSLKRYGLSIDGGDLLIGEYSAATLEDLVGSSNMTPNLQAAHSLISNIIAADTPLAGRLSDALDRMEDLGEAEMKVAVSQLIGESTLGARQAAAESAFKTQGAVLGRLDKIHSQGGHTPPAAGDKPDNNRLWLGGFGSWNKQKNADDVFGYDYNLSGLALGYDHELDGAPLTLGVVSSLSFGKIENNNGRDSIETDTVSLGVYGSYRFESGLFMDANLGYGHSRNESTVNWVLGGQKTGNFDIDSWQAGARTGYIFDLGGFNLTPSLGLRYLYTKQGSWSESLDQAAMENNAVTNWFTSRSDSQVEIPLHLTANTNIDAGGLLITPELRAGVNYAAKEADNKLQMGFVGADETITLQGVKPPRTSFLAGTGLKIKLNDTMDVFVNYDLTTASGFTGHNASAGLGFQF